MQIFENFSLKKHNTFGVEANAKYFVEYMSENELSDFVRSDLFLKNNFLHIGSGSNLLFVNNFDGVVLFSKIRHINFISHTDNEVRVQVGSGVVWDDFVAYCVEHGWYGTENLSLIPGVVGASAVQNIGAYGVEAKDLIDEVNVIEIASGQHFTLNNADCEYAYRQSAFKSRLKNKYFISSVVFKLSLKPQFQLSYQHLEEAVLKNGALTLQNVRKTIIDIRKSKLPDPAILGNAGSFFTNPVISKAQFLELQAQYPEMPHYFVSDSEEKIPAGWLIERCGWKGRTIGQVGVHENQALVIVNKSKATGREIVNFARLIQLDVLQQFGITLIPEVMHIY